MDRPSSVLIIGSGPNAPLAADWTRTHFDKIVVINNAWQVRTDWDYLIHPEDFPQDKWPADVRADQTIVTALDYVPAQNALGGFVYAGGTMAFTAGYWALHTLKPKVLSFIGCDMVYPAQGKTHFYGTGEPDPLRDDVTLQNLDAKSARLFLTAADLGCACVNLSTQDSRLVFPRATPETVRGLGAAASIDLSALAKREAELDYFVPSGRYWDELNRFDAKALAELDSLWLDAFQQIEA
jgi:hypothetical protein